MPSIPRGINDYTETEKQLLLSATLNCFFPTLANFNASYSILDMSDEQLESAIAESQANLTALGMHQQLEEILSEVERFKKMKATLRMFYDEGLIRPETIIPVKYLPDLFVAVPVWYFWIKPEKAAEAEKIWKKNDPEPQSEIRYFCNLFPNQAWAHTYQMFNRRMRSLTKYQGDKIPPFVSRKLCKAMELFDFIVIATPYHEKAGQDWQDLEWLHLIDPYVLGFKVGIPFFFVLARFSDTGTFPLYNEMIADTIGFLQANMEKLRGFNQVNNPYWYHPDQSATSVQQLGTILIKHTHELIDHFEKGDLFDWLRGNSSHTDLIKQQFDGHAFSPPDERGDGT